MKKILLAFFVFTAILANSQRTISGTFSPAEDYSWLVAYHLKPGGQSYIANTKINNGKFSLTIPQNSATGIYRLVYAVPQNEYYFDVIYNGKEMIELSFTTSNGATFLNSRENMLFNAYFKDINRLEQQIISFYSEGNQDVKEFEQIARELGNLQNSYETKSAGTIASNFIRANRPHIPSAYQSVHQYVKAKKENYFKNLEIDNTVLQASGFLVNKLTNYVYTALPLKTMNDEEMEKEMMMNVDRVNDKIQGVEPNFKTHLFYSLWTQASTLNYSITSDYIFDMYLKKLALNANNQDILNNVNTHNRLRLGAIAPDVKWEKNNVKYHLSNLTDSEYYVLVFWSSTCSHCLRELPELHEQFGNNDKTRLIAIGLEEDDINWKEESTKLNNFDHVIALGKWESDYAKLFDIHQTPSYFVLDKDKRIISKPNNNIEVLQFLNGMK